MIFAEHVKNKLSSLIHEMATAPWLFSKNPEVKLNELNRMGLQFNLPYIPCSDFLKNVTV